MLCGLFMHTNSSPICVSTCMHVCDAIHASMPIVLHNSIDLQVAEIHQQTHQSGSNCREEDCRKFICIKK